LRVAIPAKAGRKPNPEDGFFDITIFEPAFGIAIQQILKRADNSFLNSKIPSNHHNFLGLCQGKAS